MTITKPQMVTINRSLNDYIHLKKINQNLQMDLVVSDSLCNYWQKIAHKKDEVIQFTELKYVEADKFNESLQTSLKNEKKKGRRKNIGVGIGGTLLGILVGVICFK